MRRLEGKMQFLQEQIALMREHDSIAYQEREGGDEEAGGEGAVPAGADSSNEGA